MTEPATTEPATTEPATTEPDPPKSDFEAAATEDRPGILAEFWDFLIDNKKWWLLPILVTFLALSALVFIGGSGAAPFIYTLF